MAAVDLKKTLREQYTARTVPALVTVPPRPYLMVDGVGDPDTAPAYVDALATLYPLAYALRAAVKAATGDAYTVMPLEGLWWAQDMGAFSAGTKDDWRWTMMISLPDAVAEVDLDAVVARTVREKRLPAGGRVRPERFGDGEAAQVLHVGPFATEPATVAGLHDYIAQQGLALAGRHHEIYLSDMRRGEPARWRTVVRQPVTTP